jgi:hypothetical protein
MKQEYELSKLKVKRRGPLPAFRDAAGRPMKVLALLGDLKLLDDEALWRAARNCLSDDVRSQLEALNFKQQRETLTQGEKDTLEQLVHQYDQAVLLRAEAARLLKERGYEVSKLLAVHPSDD